MNKIKIVGAFIFVVSVILAYLSSSISQNNTINSQTLDIINEQKAFTQEISKNIFYIYKNKNSSTVQLDSSIKSFIRNMNNRDQTLLLIPSLEIKEQSARIIILWNEFYLAVQKFRDKSRVTTAYSNLILEKIVKDIYNTNLKLVVEFNTLIELHKKYYNISQQDNKMMQYTLFALLIVLLIYLFMQVKMIIAFIQQFLNTSKNIIKSSSIKELEHIEIDRKKDEVLEATNNFNFMVDKINTSIEFSSKSIENSYKSLELCEQNIEELLELLSVMQEDKDFDKGLTKKEDALILSLEELSISELNLKNLKLDLDKLVSYKNI